MAKAKGLPAHALAELFPLMQSDELRELSATIRSDGLLEDIVTLDGHVLDGRNRQAAALMAGVEPRYREFVPPEGMPLPEAAGRYVVAKNLTRRHLTPAQKANLANRVREETNISTEAAATLFGVSSRTMHATAKVKAGAVPEVTALMESGQVAASDAAAVVSEPPERQRRAAAAVKSGKSRTVRRAVENEKRRGPVEREVVYCRPCRMQGPVEKCPDCRTARLAKGVDPKTGRKAAKAAPAGTVVPERLREVFADAPRFATAAKRARELSTLMAELEASAAYKAAVNGTSNTKAWSTFVRTAGLTFAGLEPVRPCPDCGTTEQAPSADSSCQRCGDKGFLTAEDDGTATEAEAAARADSEEAIPL